jgi:hypothetical protein
MSQNSSALPAGVPSQTFRASLPVRRPRFVPLRIDARGAHVGRVEKSRSFHGELDAIESREQLVERSPRARARAAAAAAAAEHVAPAGEIIYKNAKQQDSENGSHGAHEIEPGWW